ncbi:amino acid ABC transporter substrate-binding protein [Ralstonia mojiangensis]|uniref:Amino acid ABC transporter substrate-binding protein n=1 Tax=Ralstonia mojiangensis TaxID=2953895 RepID=A0ABT2L659_9RALS|nr:amino acid ABC transporter substrate-binding protein [Ralstonia mojiangensis]MCO5412079.1 amino acid ABC transporter substrate-binding protein [Ralstonia mojiangensis]MCT7296485.1 amino acid ABC transporter substrate-binding protein [Ralstonia mojiangensis]MCT7310900.1 amino acid ABC transporter substrate-binding protein [Ralstonia mojiangensis]
MPFAARTWLLAALAVPAAVSTAVFPSTAVAATPTLDRIRDSGTVHVAYREDSIPFSYLDGAKPVGYTIDICSRLIDSIKTSLKRPDLKVQYVPVTAATRMDVVASGKADLECGSTNNSRERREKVAFTIPHYITKGRMLVKAGSPIQQWEDLNGKTVVAARGSSNADLARKLNETGMTMHVVDANDLRSAFAMLADGRANAFAGDDILLSGMRATAKNPADYRMTGKTQLVSSYAIMLSKQDPEFKKLIDQSMTRLIVDGEVPKLYKKWFQQPIPPNGVNLEVPMSYLLRDSFNTPTDSAGN